MAEPFKGDAEQIGSGVVALTVCIAQILRESDQAFPKRLESLLSGWQAEASKNGEAYCSELLGSIREALVDPKLFPNSGP
ncbi:MAG: hypothetical protein ISR48_06480 [Alphaproteobacteria bacterium]|nr:hypothetical protein [Alphaproteobacteria bacterium]